MKIVSGSKFRGLLRTQVLTCVFVLGLFALVFLPRTGSALTVTPRLELNANPGNQIQTTMKVSNEERESKTVFLRFENFNAEDETGTPRFSQRKEDLATWIVTSDQITIGPGETKEIPVTINIPGDAEPGGHFAAIFLTGTPDGSPGDVAITSKLGTLILLRVGGDFEQNADILEFETVGKKHFWTELPVGFYYRFQNTGDDHLKPLGDVQIKNTFGRLVKILAANTVDGSVLPKSIRRFLTVWVSNRGPLKQDPVSEMPDPTNMKYWDHVKYQLKTMRFGKYTATLKLAFGTKELKSSSKVVTFFIIPWQLLSVAIPTLIILFFFGRIGLRRYNRYIINRAQKQRGLTGKTAKPRK